MLGSINTNAGAQVALESLNRTNVAIQAAQKQAGTGLRVADATDDGGAYAIAQSVRASIGALTTVNQQLGQAQGLVGVTAAALTSVSHDLGTLKDLLLRIADGGIGDDQRNQYVQSYLQVVTQVANTVDGATYNGQTLLGKTDGSGPGASDKAVVASDTGATVLVHGELEAYDVNLLANVIGAHLNGTYSGPGYVSTPPETSGPGGGATDPTPPGVHSGAIPVGRPILGLPIVVPPDPVPAGARAAAAYYITLDSAAEGAGLHPSSGPLSYFDALNANLLDRLNQVGADAHAVQATIDGNTASVDSLSAGLGALVDADLGKQAAALQALQIRQRLGTQALSLANHAPQALLSLFR